jgi:hypothetical protein
MNSNGSEENRMLSVLYEPRPQVPAPDIQTENAWLYGETVAHGMNHARFSCTVKLDGSIGTLWPLRSYYKSHGYISAEPETLSLLSDHARCTKSSTTLKDFGTHLVECGLLYYGHQNFRNSAIDAKLRDSRYVFQSSKQVAEFVRADGLDKMFAAGVEKLTGDSSRDQKYVPHMICTPIPFCNVVGQFDLYDGRTVSMHVYVVDRLIIQHTSIQRAGYEIGPDFNEQSKRMLADFVMPSCLLAGVWLNEDGVDQAVSPDNARLIKTSHALVQKKLDCARDKALLSKEFFDSSKGERLKFRKQLTPLLCQGFCGQVAKHYCARCRRVRYCSIACQRKSWPLHRHRCKSQKAFCAKKWDNICIQAAAT